MVWIQSDKLVYVGQNDVCPTARSRYTNLIGYDEVTAACLTTTNLWRKACRHCGPGKKLEKQQGQAKALQRPVIYCGDHPLDNVYKFKYLGSIYSTDALQKYDVEADALHCDDLHKMWCPQTSNTCRAPKSSASTSNVRGIGLLFPSDMWLWDLGPRHSNL